MSTTVRYNGSVLATINNATRILNTKGKWVEHDIAVENVSSGGSVPSATQHTIVFEFSDNTTASITAYWYDWDDSFISDAIRATNPTTYNNKTVERALLDSTVWYIKPTETWETMFDGDILWEQEGNGDYPYCWLTEFGNTPITVGSVWRVTYNNTEYRCTGKTATLSGQSYNIIGNPIVEGGVDDGSDEPFVFSDYTRYGAWSGGLDVPNVQSNYYFKIERLTGYYNTLFDSSITFSESSPYSQIWLGALGSLQPAVGEVYRVTVDDTVYNLTAHEDSGVVYIGNPMYDWGDDDGSGVPFCIFNGGYGSWNGWTELSATEHTVKIEKQVLL